ncbi:hypothetical protein PV396_11610 [Streptomyces sp. ME02-8801-2C]|uniref:hypothetical protein n=1 Tax=Streptomyces sp. ME02-8801-2C TaxID=3028680 RepID=UPI0029BD7096|nr:hypothetical protein [Streptomyces sp. ME02-8801-2C]MDX3452587.1 hypothetical protein [Streptomyces sp. ME02-8801-2C]
MTSADFARSHTGALATSWRVTRAPLRQAGAVLVDAVAALSRVRLPARPRAGVGLVTAQAGPGLLLTDNLRSHGVRVPPLVERTVKELGDLLPALTYQRNPVDTGRPSATLTQVVERVSEDPDIDVTAVYGLLEPTAVDLAAALTAACTPTPLVAVIGGPAEQTRQTRREFGDAGIPSAVSPAAGATMIRALVEDAVIRARLEAADIKQGVRQHRRDGSSVGPEAAPRHADARSHVRSLARPPPNATSSVRACPRSIGRTPIHRNTLTSASK